MHKKGEEWEEYRGEGKDPLIAQRDPQALKREKWKRKNTPMKEKGFLTGDILNDAFNTSR
jgi:hypothetical protein